MKNRAAIPMLTKHDELHTAYGSINLLLQKYNSLEVKRLPMYHNNNDNNNNNNNNNN